MQVETIGEIHNDTRVCFMDAHWLGENKDTVFSSNKKLEIMCL